MSKNQDIAKNMSSMLQLLDGLVQISHGDDQSDVALFITNDLCLRLLHIILTGNAERGLAKRDAV